MIVYRLENMDGVGPFDSTFKIEVMAFYESGNIHPAPLYDGIGVVCNDRFGCLSLEHLATWFNPIYIEKHATLDEVRKNNLYAAALIDRKNLTDAGYHVSLYTVDRQHMKIGRSGLQVAFDINNAKIFNKIDLNHLYNMK